MQNKRIEVEMKNLRQLLQAQWGEDSSMVDYCLKTSKYIEVNGVFIDVCDSKPKIDSDMWFDDETTTPEESFENFRQYNLRLNGVNLKKKSSQNHGWEYKLYAVNHYINDKTDGRLVGLTYENEEDVKRYDFAVEVGDDELLEKINDAIREVQADYEKRLKTYWKRYSHKVIARGYWANR